MRPLAWLWFDAMPGAALFLLLSGQHFDFIRLGLTILILILIDSAATTLNDLYDIETDAASIETSRHKRPLVAGIISPRDARLQWAALSLTAIGVAFSLGSWTPAATALALAVGVAYSVPPLRLCASPRLSNLFWYVCGCAFYLVVGATTEGAVNHSSILWLLAFFSFYALGENFSKDLRDLDNDREAGKMTVVVMLGCRRAAVWSWVGGAIGSCFYIALAATEERINSAYLILMISILAFWGMRSFFLCRGLTEGFQKSTVRALHLGFIRTYLAANGLIVLGLSHDLIRPHR